MLRATADKIIKLIKKINPVKLLKEKGNGKVKPATVSGIFAAALVLVITLMFTAGNLSFGYKLLCDGEPVGITATKSEALSAIEEAKNELASIPSAREAEEIKVTFTVTTDDKISVKDSVKNLVVACYDGRVECYGIFADGKLLTNLSTKEEADTLLSEYKNQFKNEGTVSVSLSKDVEVAKTRAAAEDINTKSEAFAALKAPETVACEYTSEKDSNLEETAKLLNTTVEKLKEVNPGIDEKNIKKGDKIKYEYETPVVAVVTSSEYTSKETIEYETKSIEDSESYEGTTTVVTPGITGEKQVKYRITAHNGVEVARKTLEEKVTKEPVAATVKVGTMPRPATASTGSFMTPYHGILTSRYGSYRSRGTPHTGVDLAGPTGGDVVAADGGTVSFAGWNNSYGYLVKIKHDNGYETYYAHLSALKVSQGEKVAKGQLVGLLGSTGNSTGPHLHFEVRLNGKPVNPHNFISVD